PSSSRPSSVKNETAVSRDSTTMPMLSIRLTVMSVPFNLDRKRPAFTIHIAYHVLKTVVCTTVYRSVDGTEAVSRFPLLNSSPGTAAHRPDGAPGPRRWRPGRRRYGPA